MRGCTVRVLVRKVQKAIEDAFCKFFDLDIGDNATYDEEKVARVLRHAAENKISVGEAAEQLKELGSKVPSGSDVLYHLLRHNLRWFKRCFRGIIDDTLRQARKARLFRVPVDIAIDFNDIPWYGKLLYFIVRDRAKDGTKRFIRFATVSVVVRGKRLVLDVMPVTSKTTKEEVVATLIGSARRWVKIRRVLLDRGFYSVKVVKLLRRLRLKYLMPAKETAPVKELMQKLLRTRRRITRHTIRSTSGSVGCILFIAWNEERRKWQPFITNIKVHSRNRETLAESYRRRWSIETSYRMKNNFKAKSCSKKYAVRYIQFMLCICMYNFWALLNALYAILQGKTPGDPEITLDRFVFYLRTFVFQGAG